MKRRRARSLALGLTLVARARGAADTQTELWPEAQAFLKLGPRARLHFLADKTYAGIVDP